MSDGIPAGEREGETRAGASLVLSVVRGQPTLDELAAIVAVLVRRASREADGVRALAPAPASRSEWSSRSALMRAQIVPGPGAWKRSALPR